MFQIGDLTDHRADSDDGYLLPRNPLNVESDWYCGNCFRSRSGKDIRDSVEELKTELDSCLDDEALLYNCLVKGKKLIATS